MRRVSANKKKKPPKLGEAKCLAVAVQWADCSTAVIQHPKTSITEP